MFNKDHVMRTPEDRAKQLGYKIGTLAVYTISGCVMALIVGVTVKILTCMF